MPPIARFTQATSGYGERARLVIRNEQAWRAAWLQLYRDYGSMPPLPAVDFARHNVVIAAMGMQRTGGYTTTIDRIVSDDEHATASVQERYPGQGCITTQALTEPFDAVVVPLLPEAVTFDEHREIVDCTR